MKPVKSLFFIFKVILSQTMHVVEQWKKKTNGQHNKVTFQGVNKNILFPKPATKNNSLFYYNMWLAPGIGHKMEKWKIVDSIYLKVH